MFEQAWLLHALHEEYGLTLDVIARRVDRSVSWVSRRLSLVRTLPAPMQQHVRDGSIVAHAAMKYLVPLARAKAEDGVRLAAAIAPHRLTTRQIGRLYQYYLAGAGGHARAGAERSVARAPAHRRDRAAASPPGGLRA